MNAMFQDIKPHIADSSVGEIIALAAVDGSAQGVSKEAKKYLSSDNLHFYGWLVNEKVVGICGFEVHSEKVEIHLIAVAGDCQRQGIGSAMIIALQDKYHLPLEAETVEEAVGFYRKLGFDSTSFPDPEWGEKYTCVLQSKPNRTSEVLKEMP
jgi:ribosomal protein S18 acetylase RimI-like enzyme